MSQATRQAPGDAFRSTAALWLTGHRHLTRYRHEAINRAAVALDLLWRDRDWPPSRRAGMLVGARRELSGFLAAGLELRLGARETIGQVLTSTAPPAGVTALWRPDPGPLDIYRALEHGGLEPPPRLNVCDDCHRVFRSKRGRASKCGRCSSSPRPRPEPKPWHLASHAQETVDETGEPVGWSVGYAANCQACGGRFDSTDARQRYCANCGGGAGRKRRHRGSGSQRGRQRFRFEGPPNLTGLSVARSDGSSAELHVEGRIIETSDAEAAKALDHFATLRRI